jgi:hypothetical protein
MMFWLGFFAGFGAAGLIVLLVWTALECAPAHADDTTFASDHAGELAA